MTSTGTFQGRVDGRNSSKVLKPPGGGSSDIFGVPDSSMANSPRRVKQSHNQSSLGSGFFGDAASNEQASSNGSASVPDSPRSKPDGNPVTGSGYEGQNGSANGGGSGASSIASEKSSTDSSPSSGGGATRLKNRVPPGGFSSGLW